MTIAVLRRLGIGALTLWVVSILVFLIIHHLPGDPISVLLRQYATPETRAALEAYWGLDQPLLDQYVAWMGRLLQGDFGTSITSNLQVSDILAERLPRTMVLMLGGLLIALLIAVPGGMLAASRRGSLADHGLTTGSLVLQAQPEFWIGSLLVLVFGVRLAWFPTSGYVDFADDPLDWLAHSVMPMVTIAVVSAGLLLRTVRASMVTELQQDHVMLARSNGVAGWRIIGLHAGRNALAPTITVVGLQVGILMSGAVITERVFGYPGMGLTLVNSLIARDYPVVQTGILVFAGLFILTNTVVDIVSMWIDPRARAKLQGGR
ncbi:ABC transporter permease [Pseudactinotalea suaedae]|uniref:ABC transporter permease n=1 Tax=Pseudactinotalea suaedae TaxID=1524924 RepID=UPI0012E0D683|nr:ABC transporter permease [Pseudactinotalea suaedae]